MFVFVFGLVFVFAVAFVSVCVSVCVFVFVFVCVFVFVFVFVFVLCFVCVFCFLVVWCFATSLCSAMVDAALPSVGCSDGSWSGQREERKQSASLDALSWNVPRAEKQLLHLVAGSRATGALSLLAASNSHIHTYLV